MWFALRWRVGGAHSHAVGAERVGFLLDGLVVLGCLEELEILESLGLAFVFLVASSLLSCSSLLSLSSLESLGFGDIKQQKHKENNS